MSAGVLNRQTPGASGQPASGPSYPQPSGPVGPGGLPPGGPTPTATGGDPWMPADLGSIFEKYSGMALTPDVLQQIAMDLMAANVGIQMMEADYKNDYLVYLQAQLGLNQQQVALAEKQLDFQQGPYWDWYVTQYFPAQQEMSANQLAMSENQVLMSEEQTKQARASTSQANAYALGGYYQSLIPQYQLAVQMAENPQGVYALGDTRGALARGQSELAGRIGAPPVGY